MDVKPSLHVLPEEVDHRPERLVDSDAAAILYELRLHELLHASGEVRASPDEVARVAVFDEGAVRVLAQRFEAGPVPVLVLKEVAGKHIERELLVLVHRAEEEAGHCLRHPVCRLLNLGEVEAALLRCRALPDDVDQPDLVEEEALREGDVGVLRDDRDVVVEELRLATKEGEQLRDADEADVVISVPLSSLFSWSLKTWSILMYFSCTNSSGFSCIAMRGRRSVFTPDELSLSLRIFCTSLLCVLRRIKQAMKKTIILRMKRGRSIIKMTETTELTIIWTKRAPAMSLKALHL